MILAAGKLSAEIFELTELHDLWEITTMKKEIITQLLVNILISLQFLDVYLRNRKDRFVYASTAPTATESTESTKASADYEGVVEHLFINF